MSKHEIPSSRPASTPGEAPQYFRRKTQPPDAFEAQYEPVASTPLSEPAPGLTLEKVRADNEASGEPNGRYYLCEKCHEVAEMSITAGDLVCSKCGTLCVLYERARLGERSGTAESLRNAFLLETCKKIAAAIGFVGDVRLDQESLIEHARNFAEARRAGRGFPECVACGAPAHRTDAAGVPLCEQHYQHLFTVAEDTWEKARCMTEPRFAESPVVGEPTGITDTQRLDELVRFMDSHGGATFTLWANEMVELEGLDAGDDDDDDPVPAMYDTVRDLLDALIAEGASAPLLEGEPRG